MIPGFKWDNWLNQTLMKDFDKIVLNQSDYLKNVSELIISTPIDSWKIYFKWALINRTAGLLNSTLEKQNFYFSNYLEFYVL